MKRPAVFFDRDNTLIVSDGYLGDPAKVLLIPGAADAVARARKLGFAVVIFSNQSGVARGMFTEEDVQAVNQRMDELLRAENAGAIVDRHEFCPFHPEGTVDVYARESDRRKPRPGMILAAARAMALDLERSWVIGDAARDIEAGKAAACRAILFIDSTLSQSPAAQQAPRIEPDYTVSRLSEAMDYIETHLDPAAPAQPAPKAAPAAPASPPPAGVLTQPAHARATTVVNPPAAAPAPSAPAPQSSTPPPANKMQTPAATPPAQPTAPAQPASTQPTAATQPAAPRTPKVVIGSKHVPPAGAPAARTSPAQDSPTTAGESSVRTKKPWRDEAAPQPPEPAQGSRVESLLEQIFLELRRQHEQQEADFSVSKLLAGVVQIVVLAVLLFAYLKRDTPAVQTHLMLATMLQTLTISLLIMSRQK